MRQKRAKSYRKLLRLYSLHFKFREPYQVLVDDAFAGTMARTKVPDPSKRLADLIQGNTKLMITQCAMVALYKLERESEEMKAAVRLAKGWERRKCNHKEAIEPIECVKSVIGPTNKHRYLLASDSSLLRGQLRAEVPGIPLLHCNDRGVLVLEPISSLTKHRVAELEAAKLAAPSSEYQLQPSTVTTSAVRTGVAESPVEALRPPVPHKRKAKGPNPLSVRKSKKKAAPEQLPNGPSRQVLTQTSALSIGKRRRGSVDPGSEDSHPVHGDRDESSSHPAARKRRRRRGKISETLSPYP